MHSAYTKFVFSCRGKQYVVILMTRTQGMISLTNRSVAESRFFGMISPRNTTGTPGSEYFKARLVQYHGIANSFCPVSSFSKQFG